MRIEIQQSFNPTRGYQVYDKNNRRYVRGKSAIFPRDFDENDLFELLGDANYRKFEAGKFIFELTKKQIFTATNDISYFK